MSAKHFSTKTIKPDFTGYSDITGDSNDISEPPNKNPVKKTIGKVVKTAIIAGSPKALIAEPKKNLLHQTQKKNFKRILKGKKKTW